MKIVQKFYIVSVSFCLQIAVYFRNGLSTPLDLLHICHEWNAGKKRKMVFIEPLNGLTLDSCFFLWIASKAVESIDYLPPFSSRCPRTNFA
jgi:hypothetical protein